VPVDSEISGLSRQSVVNCDGLYTVRQSTLRELAGQLDGAVMGRICRAVSYALDCR
jgi:mRNA-degrading endonuclease toxin of MazEF toxin-antitoxin module